MLYIASDQKEGITPAEMGEEESRQVGGCLPPLAEAASGTAESRHISMATQKSRQMECLPTTLAEATSQTRAGDNAAPLAQNQV
jgi:hypothetical protein